MSDCSKYFKMLEDFCGETSTSSIKDLTVQLAEGAGYYRGVCAFKNGNTRECALYREKFDNYLVAKWLLFYKNLFMAKLMVHPELEEYHIEIINTTFIKVMQCIKLENLTCDDIINKYVNIALLSHIKNYMAKNASKYCTEKYVRGKPRKFILKGAIDNQAYSLDKMREDLNYDPADETNKNCADDIEIDLREKLKDNKIGQRVLDVMLNSRKKFNIRAVDKELGLPRPACGNQLKKEITAAFNTIKSTLLEYTDLPPKKRMRKIDDSAVKYSFETSGGK